MAKAGWMIAGILALIGAATVQALALDLFARPDAESDWGVRRVSLPVPPAPRVVHLSMVSAARSQASSSPTRIAALAAGTVDAVEPVAAASSAPSAPRHATASTRSRAPARWRDVSYYTGGSTVPAAPPPPAVPVVSVESRALGSPAPAPARTADVPDGWAARVAFPDR